MMIDLKMLKSLMERGLFVSGLEQAISEESTEIPLELIASYEIRELPRPKGKRLSVFKEGASGFIKSKQFSN